MKGVIYKATNTVNGKVYIGQTTRGIESRRKQHEDYARSGVPMPLYEDMRRYGLDAFTWTVIEELEAPGGEDTIGICNIKALLNEAERRYIAKYKSFAKDWGYNHNCAPKVTKPSRKANRRGEVWLFDLQTGELEGKYQALMDAKNKHGDYPIFGRILSWNTAPGRLIVQSKIRYIAFYPAEISLVKDYLRRNVAVNLGAGRLRWPGKENDTLTKMQK